MNEIKEWVQREWILLALGVGLIVVVWVITRIVKNVRTSLAGADRDWVKPLIRLANAIALGFNAEGMFFLLRDKVTTIPIYVAAGGFFIFELFQVINMMLAARKYAAEKTPGKYASMVWFIAMAAVGVVCLNAGRAAEVGLRLALAVIVVLGWQVTLTADGVTKSRWVFAHWWESKLAHAGLKIGRDTNDGGLDYDRIARDARIRKLVTLGDRVQESGKAGGRMVRRLNRMLRSTPPEDMDRVVEQLKKLREARVRLGLDVPRTDVVPGDRTGGTTRRTDGTYRQEDELRPAGTADRYDGREAGTEDRYDGTERRDGTTEAPVQDDPPGTSDPDEVLIQECLEILRDKGTLTVSQVAFVARDLVSGRNAGQSRAARLRNKALARAMAQAAASEDEAEPGE